MKALLAATSISLSALICSCSQEPARQTQKEPETQAEPEATGYAATAVAINEIMRANHYNPAELDGAPYRAVEKAVIAMASIVETDEAFIDGFNEIWKTGPFSHVVLNKARGSADDLAAYFDNLRVGGDGASLTWNDDVAVLTVNTMMGLDTIEQIDAAYVEIAEKGASSLIIDLRQNGGGAFVVRPLVSHLISEQLDAGGFVSQEWNATHDRAPTAEDITAVEPWDGWSIRTFWNNVQTQPLTRVSFQPAEPIYSGQAFVLTSSKTASAAEMATDAIKISGRGVIIGETTAGQMLSQKIYDVPGGFHLSLPIADYYSVVNGRIEGKGVTPDIAVDADDAMETALQR